MREVRMVLKNVLFFSNTTVSSISLRNARALRFILPQPFCRHFFLILFTLSKRRRKFKLTPCFLLTFSRTYLWINNILSRNSITLSILVNSQRYNLFPYTIILLEVPSICLKQLMEVILVF